MASYPIVARPGFIDRSEFRVLELSEKIISALCEGPPQRNSKQKIKNIEKGNEINKDSQTQKRTREEGEVVGDAEKGKFIEAAATENDDDNNNRQLIFTIRGNEDEVVICTHSATFALRRHEFSNNFYFMTGGVDAEPITLPDGTVTHKQCVQEKANSVCEVHPTRTRIETIRSVLNSEERTYVTLAEAESWGSDHLAALRSHNETGGEGGGVSSSSTVVISSESPSAPHVHGGGPHFSSSSSRAHNIDVDNDERYYGLLTFSELVSKTLCSRGEVADFLSKEGAFLVGGKVRLLHPSLWYSVIEAALHEVNRMSGVGFATSERTQNEGTTNPNEGEDEGNTTAENLREKQWSLDHFPLNDLVVSLSSLYPSIVVRAALSTVIEEVEPQKNNGGTDKQKEGNEEDSDALSQSTRTTNKIYAFRRPAVLSAIAQSIISPAITNPNTSPIGTHNLASPLNSKNRRQFLKEWQDKICILTSQMWLVSSAAAAASDASLTPQPTAHDHILMTDEEMLALLEGLVFVNNDTNSPETAVVTWCPHWRLPVSLPQRIAYLLSRKPRWPGNELRAYLKHSLEVGQNFDVAVTKYCRELRSGDKSIPSTYISV